jgi:hypothetical protein
MLFVKRYWPPMAACANEEWLPKGLLAHRNLPWWIPRKWTRELHTLCDALAAGRRSNKRDALVRSFAVDLFFFAKASVKQLDVPFTDLIEKR